MITHYILQVATAIPIVLLEVLANQIERIMILVATGINTTMSMETISLIQDHLMTTIIMGSIGTIKEETKGLLVEVFKPKFLHLSMVNSLRLSWQSNHVSQIKSQWLDYSMKRNIKCDIAADHLFYRLQGRSKVQKIGTAAMYRCHQVRTQQV